MKWKGQPSEECQIGGHDLCSGKVMTGYKQPCTCECHNSVICPDCTYPKEQGQIWCVPCHKKRYPEAYATYKK